MILEAFNPEFRFSSVIKISPVWMKQKGFQCLLLDIDNTLLPRGSCVVPEEHLLWLKTLQDQGIAIILSSNNGGSRIKKIEKQLQEWQLQIPVMAWAGKPLPMAYRDVFQIMHSSYSNPSSLRILAAGDQLFTDVLGAHWAGLPAAWLRPLSRNDFISTKILRILERWLANYFDSKGTLPQEDVEYQALNFFNGYKLFQCNGKQE